MWIISFRPQFLRRQLWVPMCTILHLALQIMIDSHVWLKSRDESKYIAPQSERQRNKDKEVRILLHSP